MLTVDDLRKSFLDFFKDRDHKIVPSSPLVPKDDPTLLFTTAGMVQFKPMYTGTVDLEFTRASSVQKCLRTSDLELVGKTKRHLTFFEMLGNFSFGDYFKEGAIEYAWNYSTDVIGFPEKDIWISIFEKDDEAFDIWNKKIGVPENRIVRLGKKDNFWGPAGDSGACGPCSELYLDRGEKYGCKKPDCKPGCDCERYLEYWNLVFIQYNQDTEGKQTPLPQTGIDTGMGLERLALLVQGVDSIYETDEFSNLIKFVSDKSGTKYSGKYEVPIKVIVEHSRTLTFAISDGAYPSNEGRGYVLRRILRRAMRFCRQIGISEPFIYTIADPIINAMGDFYPEIRRNEKNIKSVIESEEKRFLETLDNGIDRLDEIVKSLTKSGDESVSGKDAFLLYDTFGFPLEMTTEIAGESGLSVDTDEFDAEMKQQRERGKQSWKGGGIGLENSFKGISGDAGNTEFRGYDEEITDSKILSIYKDDKPSSILKKGQKGLIALDMTPFYGESGGQVGDTGEIRSKNGIFSVIDTVIYNKTIIHIGEVTDGELKIKEKVNAEINHLKRNLIRANHTATHLLQRALLEVLGDHVKQSGSLVEPDRFRFDFSHFNAMTDKEVKKVEEIVNQKIWENIDVETEISTPDEAVKKGAIAVFDEKYDEEVRVVKVGDFSMELCGGTHVSSTGNIGVFKILKEASPGAGMRRIEALTLKGVLDSYRSHSEIISGLSKSLSVGEDDILKKIDDLIGRTRSMEKDLEKYKKENLSSEIEDIIGKSVEKNGVKIISHLFRNVDARHLRSLSDSVRSKVENSIVCFGSDYDGKALLLFAASNNSVKKGADCGKIIKDISKIVEGGGGGRKDLAQAGGKAPQFLHNALEEGVKIAEEMIG